MGIIIFFSVLISGIVSYLIQKKWIIKKWKSEYPGAHERYLEKYLDGFFSWSEYLFVLIFCSVFYALAFWGIFYYVSYGVEESKTIYLKYFFVFLGMFLSNFIFRAPVDA
jgi:hypothetical protein